MSAKTLKLKTAVLWGISTSEPKDVICSLYLRLPELPLKFVNQSGPRSHQFSSVKLSCVRLCNPMNCSMPGFPVHHQLPELAQTHVHPVGDAIQPSHPLSSPSPPAFNLSQHQGLFQWVSSSHQVAEWRQKTRMVVSWCYEEAMEKAMAPTPVLLPGKCLDVEAW